MRAALKATVAATLLGAATLAGATEDLGTLFYTPEQRARMDQMRRGDPAPGPAARGHEARITGYVKRSDGRSTVWIDGLAVPVASAQAERILEPGAVRDYPDRDELRIERKK